MLRFRDIRVIGAEGDALGIMQSRQALTMAREAGLDLVMVAPNAQPPVCKIIDYGKYKYETEKRDKENKKKPQEVKGIMLRPGTGLNDLNTLVRRAKEFLGDGDKVRVVCRFRAREVTHPEIGLKQMQKIAEMLAEISTVEKAASLDGKQMVMVLLPKPGAQGKKKNAEDQNKQDGGEEV